MKLACTNKFKVYLQRLWNEDAAFRRDIELLFDTPKFKSGQIERGDIEEERMDGKNKVE